MSKTFPDFMVIGLTGKIGTGKSLAKEYLVKHGFTGIDCDQIVHELYEPGCKGAEKIRSFFDEIYIDKKGGVNRRKLFRMLLKNPKKWEVLNRTIHPLVAEELRKKFRKIKTKHVALEIQIYTAKLFSDFIDELWILESNEKTQCERLAMRKINPETINHLNNIQQSDFHEKIIKIQNNGTLGALFAKIKEQLKRVA